MSDAVERTAGSMTVQRTTGSVAMLSLERHGSTLGPPPTALSAQARHASVNLDLLMSAFKEAHNDSPSPVRQPSLASAPSGNLDWVLGSQAQTTPASMAQAQALHAAYDAMKIWMGVGWDYSIFVYRLMKMLNRAHEEEPPLPPPPLALLGRRGSTASMPLDRKRSRAPSASLDEMLRQVAAGGMAHHRTASVALPALEEGESPAAQQQEQQQQDQPQPQQQQHQIQGATSVGPYSSAEDELQVDQIMGDLERTVENIEQADNLRHAYDAMLTWEAVSWEYVAVMCKLMYALKQSRQNKEAEEVAAAVGAETDAEARKAEEGAIAAAAVAAEAEALDAADAGSKVESEGVAAAEVAAAAEALNAAEAGSKAEEGATEASAAVVQSDEAEASASEALQQPGEVEVQHQAAEQQAAASAAAAAAADAAAETRGKAEEEAAASAEAATAADAAAETRGKDEEEGAASAEAVTAADAAAETRGKDEEEAAASAEAAAAADAAAEACRTAEEEAAVAAAASAEQRQQLADKQAVAASAAEASELARLRAEELMAAATAAEVAGGPEEAERAREATAAAQAEAEAASAALAAAEQEVAMQAESSRLAEGRASAAMAAPADVAAAAEEQAQARSQLGAELEAAAASTAAEASIGPAAAVVGQQAGEQRAEVAAVSPAAAAAVSERASSGAATALPASPKKAVTGGDNQGSRRKSVMAAEASSSSRASPATGGRTPRDDLRPASRGAAAVAARALSPGRPGSRGPATAAADFSSRPTTPGGTWKPSGQAQVSANEAAAMALAASQAASLAARHEAAAGEEGDEAAASADSPRSAWGAGPGASSFRLGSPTRSAARSPSRALCPRPWAEPHGAEADGVASPSGELGASAEAEASLAAAPKGSSPPRQPRQSAAAKTLEELKAAHEAALAEKAAATDDVLAMVREKEGEVRCELSGVPARIEAIRSRLSGIRQAAALPQLSSPLLAGPGSSTTALVAADPGNSSEAGSPPLPEPFSTSISADAVPSSASEPGALPPVPAEETFAAVLQRGPGQAVDGPAVQAIRRECAELTALLRAQLTVGGASSKVLLKATVYVAAHGSAGQKAEASKLKDGLSASATQGKALLKACQALGPAVRDLEALVRSHGKVEERLAVMGQAAGTLEQAMAKLEAQTLAYRELSAAVEAAMRGPGTAALQSEQATALWEGAESLHALSSACEMHVDALTAALVHGMAQVAADRQQQQQESGAPSSSQRSHANRVRAVPSGPCSAPPRSRPSAGGTKQAAAGHMTESIGAGGDGRIARIPDLSGPVAWHTSTEQQRQQLSDLHHTNATNLAPRMRELAEAADLEVSKAAKVLDACQQRRTLMEAAQKLDQETLEGVQEMADQVADLVSASLAPPTSPLPDSPHLQGHDRQPSMEQALQANPKIRGQLVALEQQALALQQQVMELRERCARLQATLEAGQLDLSAAEAELRAAKAKADELQRSIQGTFVALTELRTRAMTASLLQHRRNAAEARALCAAQVYRSAAHAMLTSPPSRQPPGPPSPPHRQQHHHLRLHLAPGKGGGCNSHGPDSPGSPSGRFSGIAPPASPGSPSRTRTAPALFRGRAAGFGSPGVSRGGGPLSPSSTRCDARRISLTQPCGSPGERSNGGGIGAGGFGGRWPPPPERAVPYLDDDLYQLLLQMLSETKDRPIIRMKPKDWERTLARLKEIVDEDYHEYLRQEVQHQQRVVEIVGVPTERERSRSRSPQRNEASDAEDTQGSPGGGRGGGLRLPEIAPGTARTPASPARKEGDPRQTLRQQMNAKATAKSSRAGARAPVAHHQSSYELLQLPKTPRAAAAPPVTSEAGGKTPEPSQQRTDERGEAAPLEEDEDNDAGSVDTDILLGVYPGGLYQPSAHLKHLRVQHMLAQQQATAHMQQLQRSLQRKQNRINAAAAAAGHPSNGGISPPSKKPLMSAASPNDSRQSRW